LEEEHQLHLLTLFSCNRHRPYQPRRWQEYSTDLPFSCPLELVVLLYVVEVVGGDDLVFELVAREEGKVHDDNRRDDDNLLEETDLDDRRHPEK
jgi:hypothetical protein